VFVSPRGLMPAILRPHCFWLVPGRPGPAVQRSLTLVGQILQGLRNLNVSIDRAEHMRLVRNVPTRR
jgi:hypothetical protein